MISAFKMGVIEFLVDFTPRSGKGASLGSTGGDSTGLSAGSALLLLGRRNRLLLDFNWKIDWVFYKILGFPAGFLG